MSRIRMFATTLLLVGFLAGCQANPFTGGSEISGLPGEYGKIAMVLANIVKDQGVLKDFDGSGRIDIMDPGFAFYTKTEFGGRIVGTNADLELNMDGTGTTLPAGVRDALITQLNGPLSDAQRNAILEILGWNRTMGSTIITVP